MTVLESRYYNINRILLLICGLWPYQNKFRYVRAVLILGIFVTFVIYQSILLFISDYNFKIALKIYSDIFPAILCTLQFFAFLIKPIEVRKLLNQICDEWNALKDSKEIEIAKRYGMFTKRLTEALLRKKPLKRIFFDIDRFIIALFSKSTLDKWFFCKFRYFSVCALLSWLFLVLMHFIPIINDSTAANESFLKQDGVSVQLENTYILKDRYTFLFFIFVFAGIFVMTSTTSMILAYMRHVCAMLKITCYRIEHSLDGNNLHMSISQKNRLMCQKLISAVNIQRRAMESVSI
ncbi:uncharacterized protein [Temnothorax nylanderi]|uniref:uncharacterized protein n=1 Tax=Temnothorax nylanderi TaxID=102681 RepID=UPI003A83BA51